MSGHILCIEDLNYILWSCDFAKAMWTCIFDEFGVESTRHCGCREMINEFLLLTKKGKFLWQAVMCYFVGALG